MPPVTGKHLGQRRYAALQKAYSAAWRKLSPNEKAVYQSYHHWRSSNAGRSVKNKFDREWRNNQNRPNPTDSRSDGEAGPSDLQLRGGIDDFDVEDLFPDDWFDNNNIGDMADIQNNIPEMPASTQVAQAGGTPEPMDTGVLGSGGRGPGGGTVTSASSGIAKIIPNPRLKTLHISFTKKWYKYTYGYAHTKLEGKNITRLITPYAYYPVDWVPWYLSPQEWQSLPWNSKIKKVSTDIHLLGTRTAFDHGTTLSGTATTEYVPIIKWCVGLNNKVYIDNRPLESASTEPMRPTKTKDKSLQEQFLAMYNIAGASEIPRHLNWYAAILYNQNESKFDGPNTFLNYRLDKVLHTGLANKCMNEAIINYTFEPQNGYLKPTKKAIIPMYTKEDGFDTDISYTDVIYKHQIPHILKVTNVANERGRLEMNQNLNNTNYSYTNRCDHNYYQSVEGYTFLHVHSGEHASFRNQPQVHLGILATPALNPATESANFLNSSLYTVSYAHCDVEFDMESMCTKGDAYDWPEDVKFFINKSRGFTGYGQQMLGVTATTSGRLESRVPGSSTSNVRRGNARERSETIHNSGRIHKRGGVNELAKRFKHSRISKIDVGSREREIPELHQSLESGDEFDIISREDFYASD